VPFYLAVIDILLFTCLIAMLIRMRAPDWRTHLPFFRDWTGRAIIAAVIPAPLLLYSLIITLTNPAFAIFNAQNILPSPNPIHYIIGFGVLAIPALIGVQQVWQQARHRPIVMLLPAWIITAIVLAYAPVSVQRRLLEGIFAPLCVLAVIGLIGLRADGSLPARSRRMAGRARLWIGLVLGLSLPSSAIILALGVIGATHPASPVFQASAEANAIAWLSANVPAGSVILSSHTLGNVIPAESDLRTFVGHGVETLHSAAKADQVQAFFDGQRTIAQIQASDQDPISYVLYSDTDPDEGTAATRAIWSHDLTVVYDQAGFTIYQVPK
jgi:hypothetical protein